MSNDMMFVISFLALSGSAGFVLWMVIATNKLKDDPNYNPYMPESLRKPIGYVDSVEIVNGQEGMLDIIVQLEDPNDVPPELDMVHYSTMDVGLTMSLFSKLDELDELRSSEKPGLDIKGVFFGMLLSIPFWLVGFWAGSKFLW